MQCGGSAPARRVKRTVGQSNYTYDQMDEMEVALTPEDCTDGPLTLFVSGVNPGDSIKWTAVMKWLNADIDVKAVAGEIISLE